MNLFAKARDWLTTQLEAAAGEVVTYTRGGESITLTAVVGHTLSVVGEEGAARIAYGDRDYLIAVTSLTFGEPFRGDRITHVIDGAAVVFEVKDVEGGEPVWRHSDATRSVYRIHVKQR